MAAHDKRADSRPVALITGVGRGAGIGAAVAARLARDGFDVGVTYWSRYDERMPWGADHDAITELLSRLGDARARTVAVEADLERADAATEVFDRIEDGLGAIQVLVMCHCESVASGIVDTSVESFDLHFAVNARATWLLVREFGLRYRGAAGRGRVIALTSDDTVGNVPYGASKAALDRITLAAARELAHLGITANIINPGPTDTGWMTPEVEAELAAATPLGRVGRPDDVASLVSFLCSSEGGWINAQVLHSNGGFGAG